MTPDTRLKSLHLEDGAVSYLDFSADAAQGGGGPGRPRIHFAHATGFNALTYRRLLGPLAADFDIKAWDARGHGRTTLPADPSRQTSWMTYADDLAVFLRACGHAPALLIGHSMGGTVSLLTAAAHRDVASGVLMLDPPILAEDASPGVIEAPIGRAAARRRAVFASQEEMIAAYQGRGAFQTWPQDVLADYVEGGTRRTAAGETELACAPAWEAATFNGQAHDTWSAVRRVDVPVLVIGAEHGSTLRPGSLEAMARLNPHFETAMMPAGTHFFPMEQMERVRAQIRAFARRVFGG